MKSRILLLVAFASIMAISMIAAATVTEDVMAGKRYKKSGGCSSNSVCGQSDNKNGDSVKNDKIKGQGNGINGDDNNNNNDVSNGVNGIDGDDKKYKSETGGNGGNDQGGNGLDGADA